jgi:hypothetical protein
MLWLLLIGPIRENDVSYNMSDSDTVCRHRPLVSLTCWRFPIILSGSDRLAREAALVVAMLLGYGIKQRQSGTADKVVFSDGQLRRQMSELLSVREKVAQAELSGRLYRMSRSRADGDVRCAALNPNLIEYREQCRIIDC